MKRCRIGALCMVGIWLLTAAPAVSAAAEPEIGAKAYVLIDGLTGQVVCGSNADEKRPMASTTKIMTTLLTLESCDLDEPFIVDSEAIMVEGSSMGLQPGDTVTKRVLCTGMLLPSGNDGANAAAVKVGGDIPHFVEMMNARAAEIGMTRTCFATPSGLDDEGHGASAYDMALLAREALKNDDFAAICSQKSMTVSYGNPPYARTLTNTNKLLSMDDSVIGVKTGFTDAAGRCLVSAAERGGRRLICVTLFDRNDWADHEALYDYGFAAAQDYTVPLPDGLTADVEGGSVQKIRCYLSEPLHLTAWNGIPPEVRTTVEMPPFLVAPVEKGEQIGTVIFHSGRLETARLPLLAAESAEALPTKPKESPLQSVLDWFRSLFG
ncbi:MAG: D-alanyl-D-alanine carboxypeptidase [Oscillospiraceae bacterium]|nr:D-alanyl-D-alanine carboxypeptidase [Oscillospiraceae bacterium]